MWDLFQSTYSSLLFTSLVQLILLPPSYPLQGLLRISRLTKRHLLRTLSLTENLNDHAFTSLPLSCLYSLSTNSSFFSPQRVPLVELQICCFISILIFSFHCETFFFYPVSYSIVICTFIASVIVFTLLLFAIKGIKLLTFFGIHCEASKAITLPFIAR